MSEKPKCPFCGAGLISKYTGGQMRFYCNTFGPDESGEYETGIICDKTVFRNGFLRCREIIDELATLDYKPNIPETLWDRIVEESKKIT